MARPTVLGFTGEAPIDRTLIDRLLTTLSEALRRLDRALTSEAMVTQTLGTGDTKVFHGLQRKPRGYIVCGLSADARVFSGTADEAHAPLYLNLRGSAAVTATLLFF